MLRQRSLAVKVSFLLIADFALFEEGEQVPEAGFHDRFTYDLIGSSRRIEIQRSGDRHFVAVLRGEGDLPRLRAEDDAADLSSLIFEGEEPVTAGSGSEVRNLAGNGEERKSFLKNLFYRAGQPDRNGGNIHIDNPLKKKRQP